MIINKIKMTIKDGTVIPKPSAKAEFTVKGWGKRRSSSALIYHIPNHNNPNKPYQKGITEEEFTIAYVNLTKTGELTRTWFNQTLPACAKEGGCNFTTIGGIFELLNIARYEANGVYKYIK
ncbi:MAG: hypothetical protein JKX72_09465 [Robiginitomaculum sp.]|nr:hypothetical protein [Robiginitomaculum sp.]